MKGRLLFLAVAASACVWPGGALASQLPRATSVASDRVGRFAVATPDRRVAVFDEAGRQLGDVRLPGDPADEDPIYPPQVVGVVDGGAVIVFSVPRDPPYDGSNQLPPLPSYGYYRPGSPFAWLCGRPETKPCPYRGPHPYAGGVGALVAVGQRWAWFVQEAGAEWAMRFDVQDGKLRWRKPKRREEEGISYVNGGESFAAEYTLRCAAEWARRPSVASNPSLGIRNAGDGKVRRREGGRVPFSSQS